jgi:hypothetical protein
MLHWKASLAFPLSDYALYELYRTWFLLSLNRKIIMLRK